jgi:hypothetical protein
MVQSSIVQRVERRNAAWNSPSILTLLGVEGLLPRGPGLKGKKNTAFESHEWKRFKFSVDHRHSCEAFSIFIFFSLLEAPTPSTQFPLT